MIEVAYSREAMRALLMLDAGERERAIETIDKLSKAYDALRTEAENAAVKKALEEADAAEKEAEARAVEEAAQEKAAKEKAAKEKAARDKEAEENKAAAPTDEDENGNDKGNGGDEASGAPEPASTDGDVASDDASAAEAAKSQPNDDNASDDADSATSAPVAMAEAQTQNQLIEDSGKPAPVELEPIDVPGTLPLGGRGDFCLAPFSKTGDFVVALTDKITVVSLIDILDDLQEASSK